MGDATAPTLPEAEAEGVVEGSGLTVEGGVRAADREGLGVSSELSLGRGVRAALLLA